MSRSAVASGRPETALLRALMTTKMTELRTRRRRERLGTRILTRVLSFTPRLVARYSRPGNFNVLEAAGFVTPGGEKVLCLDGSNLL